MIETVEQLEEVLSRPNDGDRALMRELEGDLLILGVGGKMGPSLARRARRACAEAGVNKRILGVSRFSSPESRRELEAAGIETIAADLPPVMADPTQMQQVLMNLCTNAAHAMEGAETRRLGIRLEAVRLSEEELRFEPDIEAGHFVRLAVSDTGCGIDPRLRERIFEPYFTTKPAGKGTGLGLSVVHGIVRHHGGFIRVESEPGLGTEIQVFLPAARPLATDAARPAAPVAIPHGEGVVLFVDDEPALAEMGLQMLSCIGYTPEIRTSPLEALEAFRAHPRRYCAVVTDLSMPQMNGIQLARRLREIHPGIPVALCTGFSDPGAEDRARAAGVAAFLYKPLTLADLANALKTLLEEENRRIPSPQGS